MLIRFCVGNYRSFKDIVTFSMVAAAMKAPDRPMYENNVIEVPGKLSLLKSAGIYGANASGKTNLVRAMSFMKHLVLVSSKDTQAGEPIPVESFRLSTETEDRPSFFEIVFLMEGKRYRYAFEVNAREVVSEELFFVPKTREAKLFERDSGGISVSDTFKEARGLEGKTRPNALFLSVVSQFNGEIAGKVISWFADMKMNVGIEGPIGREDTIQHLRDDKKRDNIVRFVTNLDLGIEDIQVEERQTTNDLPVGLRELVSQGVVSLVPAIKTVHKKFDAEGNCVSHETFDMFKEESHGTQRLFAMTGPIVDVLKQGRVLVVDELDARLHPLLTSGIIRLFNSRETNPKGAQLIFTTHDTNLLSSELFRKDQIWFTEKNKQGATDLYSLVEYKVKDDAPFERDYIDGRYGAIPFMGDIRRLVGVAHD